MTDKISIVIPGRAPERVGAKAGEPGIYTPQRWDYGFRVRPTDLGLARDRKLKVLKSAKADLGGPARNDNSIVFP